MRTETDPVTWMQAGAAALGAEKRSDEAPRSRSWSGRVAEMRSAAGWYGRPPLSGGSG